MPPDAKSGLRRARNFTESTTRTVGRPLLIGNNYFETTSFYGGQPPAGLRMPRSYAAKRKSCSGCFQSQNARVKNGDAPHITRLHAFRGLGEDGGFVYFRVPRRRRSRPGAAKEPEWAAGTRRHRRDDSSSVAHRAKEEVSSRMAASPRRIGSADPSSRLGSWSRVAPSLPQKIWKTNNLQRQLFLLAG